eukprot:TRINITY_DN2366_c0_g1_i5.p1 TRINITY_DN2366_c0_g1~~TRINITY_DN2366_c0_g1_i5.p1  ORF type:complete len:307 (-),score=61.96 TRINITY_DN2366_c0_g1_i5:204-1124(-)
MCHEKWFKFLNIKILKFLATNFSNLQQNFQIDLTQEKIFLPFFVDLVLGTSKQVSYKARTKCDQCKGSGVGPMGKSHCCGNCNGKGYTGSGKGIFRTNTLCSMCKGFGSLIDKPCLTCNGDGTVSKKMELTVNLPPGLETSHIVRIPEAGDTGNRCSGLDGSLVVTVKVQEHPIFRKEKFDLHMDLPISLSQAVLGGFVTIKTLTGSTELGIPPKTQPGNVLIVYGEGVPYKTSSQKGNLFVRVQVPIPTNLTPEQEVLVKKFMELEGNASVTPQPLFLRERFFRMIHESFGFMRWWLGKVVRREF